MLYSVMCQVNECVKLRRQAVGILITKSLLLLLAEVDLFIVESPCTQVKLLSM